MAPFSAFNIACRHLKLRAHRCGLGSLLPAPVSGEIYYSYRHCSYQVPQDGPTEGGFDFISFCWEPRLSRDVYSVSQGRLPNLGVEGGEIESGRGCDERKRKWSQQAIYCYMVGTEDWNNNRNACQLGTGWLNYDPSIKQNIMQLLKGVREIYFHW